MSSGAPYFSGFRFQVFFTDANDPMGGGGLGISLNVSIGLGGISVSTRMSDAGFAEVGGLEMNVEMKTHPEGGRQQGVRQLVGRATYSNLVLKRGMSRNLESWRWAQQIAQGVRPVPRKAVTVELLDNDYSRVVARWNVHRAVPVKMKVSDMNAKSGEVAIEEMHLAHEGWDLDLSLGNG